MGNFLREFPALYFLWERERVSAVVAFQLNHTLLLSSFQESSGCQLNKAEQHWAMAAFFLSSTTNFQTCFTYCSLLAAVVHKHQLWIISKSQYYTRRRHGTGSALHFRQQQQQFNSFNSQQRVNHNKQKWVYLFCHPALRILLRFWSYFSNM